MIFSRISGRNLKSSLNACRWILCSREQNHQFLFSHHYHSTGGSSDKDQLDSVQKKDQLDPFSLVADELSLISNRLREMVVAEVLLLMSTALNVPLPPNDAARTLTTEIRSRQRKLAEITEMIHVASLLHDDVLDDADTRRGIGSVNCVMGNKVVSMIAKTIEHLVRGEIKQMSTTSDQRCSMEYYMEKTYYKTGSLISNSCQSIAVLSGQTAEVTTLAFEYGKNLGLAYQLIDDVLDFTGTSASLGKGSLSDIKHGIVTAPLLFAMEEFPQLRTVIKDGFDNPANVDIALDYLAKSRGIQRTRELALNHVKLAESAIDSLPVNDDEVVRKSRRALVDITQRIITRTKMKRNTSTVKCISNDHFATILQLGEWKSTVSRIYFCNKNVSS